MSVVRIMCAVGCALVWMAGCGSAPAGPAESAAGSGDAPPATSAVVTRQLGEWVMAPPPGQEREVALVRYALATPPAVQAFAATSPTSKEQQSFEDVLRLRREEPGSPILVSLQRKLDELEAVRVTFLPEEFIVTTAGGTEMTPYQVEEDLGTRLVILEGGTAPEASRRKILSFDGPDRMVITSGATRIPMTRVPAGAVPSPNEVPPAPAGGSSAGVGTQTSGGAVPVSGDADYDACVAEYYRCIDSMPASAREAMGPSLAHTKKAFTEAQGDPERMRSAHESCKEAVEFARATFCR